jgi:hypothetical protein
MRKLGLPKNLTLALDLDDLVDLEHASVAVRFAQDKPVGGKQSIELEAIRYGARPYGTTFAETLHAGTLRDSIPNVQGGTLVIWDGLDTAGQACVLVSLRLGKWETAERLRHGTSTESIVALFKGSGLYQHQNGGLDVNGSSSKRAIVNVQIPIRNIGHVLVQTPPGATPKNAKKVKAGHIYRRTIPAYAGDVPRDVPPGPSGKEVESIVLNSSTATAEFIPYKANDGLVVTGAIEECARIATEATLIEIS